MFTGIRIRSIGQEGLHRLLPSSEGKIFTLMQYVSSEYDSEKGNTTHFIIKLTNLALFLKNLVVSSLHEFEMCCGCVFHKRIYCII